MSKRLPHVTQLLAEVTKQAAAVEKNTAQKTAGAQKPELVVPEAQELMKAAEACRKGGDVVTVDDVLAFAARVKG